MADSDITETMNEIEEQDAPRNRTNLRESLQSDISILEIQIKEAQETTDNQNQMPYGFNPVSPEQANEDKRNLVFLKKDLAQKKFEYEKLDEKI